MKNSTRFVKITRLPVRFHFVFLFLSHLPFIDEFPFQQKYRPCSSNIWIWSLPSNTIPYEPKSQLCCNARHNGWIRISKCSTQKTRIPVAVMMKTRKWKSVPTIIRMFRVRAEQMCRWLMKTDGRRLLRRGDNKVVWMEIEFGFCFFGRMKVIES